VDLAGSLSCRPSAQGVRCLDRLGFRLPGPGPACRRPQVLGPSVGFGSWT